MRKKIAFLIHLFVGISFCSVNVLCNDKVNVGIVTPGNYKDEGGCIFDNRTTVQMGEEFANLSCNLYGDTNLLFHYKNANAWEIDLKSGQNNTNLNVDDVDLAIFCGHGLAKGYDKFGNYYPHNSLHFYTNNSNKVFHKKENESGANLDVIEANWGSGASKTKWVVVYACNFLNSTDGCYKSVLNGVHQVLGFSTKMYITKECSGVFAFYLSHGFSIRDSFFWSAIEEMGPNMNEKCIATVLTAKQSVEDTIFNYSSKPSPWGRGGTYYQYDAVIRYK